MASADRRSEEDRRGSKKGDAGGDSPSRERLFVQYVCCSAVREVTPSRSSRRGRNNFTFFFFFSSLQEAVTGWGGFQ